MSDRESELERDRVSAWNELRQAAAESLDGNHDRAKAMCERARARGAYEIVKAEILAVRNIIKRERVKSGLASEGTQAGRQRKA